MIYFINMLAGKRGNIFKLIYRYDLVSIIIGGIYMYVIILPSDMVPYVQMQ